MGGEIRNAVKWQCDHTTCLHQKLVNLEIYADAFQRGLAYSQTMDSASIVKVDDEPAHDGPMRGVISRVLDLPSHGTAPAHRFAFWLAVLAFIAGVSNT